MMTLGEFHRLLIAAFRRHCPQARVTIDESRGISLSGQAELAPDTFLAVYYNALTGKTSYALIQRGQRKAGYDNYRFWHRHPLEAPADHISCDEPSLDDAIAELVAASEGLI